MQRYRDGAVEWLQFDLLSDSQSLKHAIFLRGGGKSQPPYDSLNFSFYVGDQPNVVEENLLLAETSFRKEIKTLLPFTRAHLVHGDLISIVDRFTPSEVKGSDGLVTSIRGKPLLNTHADCQIALIYDPILNVIANLHCGWAGNVLNLYQKGVDFLKTTYGSNPSDLLACIGPSLGPEFAEFIHYRTEFPEEFWAFQVAPNYFDLWALADYQFQKVGLLPHHIEIARLCSYSNSHDFFSYRRDRSTGRNGTMIALV